MLQPSGTDETVSLSGIHLVASISAALTSTCERAGAMPMLLPIPTPPLVALLQQSLGRPWMQ